MGPTRSVAPRTRLRRRAGVGAAAALVLLMATGCTANEAFFFDMPDPASEQAPIIQNLWNGAWIAAWAVGILTWGLMLFAFFVYRRRKNTPELPEQTRYNIPIEVLYTVVPLILIVGLFYFTARDQAELTAVRNDEDLTVNVVGWKWNWGFNYVDEDVYEAGTPGVPATLVLPVDEKVRFELTSPDVIHSFWVPAWLFKMDVIPGRTNVFELTPNKIGTFAGKCAELCGVDHSRMLFNVKVVERAEYDAFIAELRAKGQTGLLETGRTTDEGMTEQEKQL